MEIPKYVLNEASQYASKHGGSVDVYNAIIYGFQLGNKERLRGNGQLKPINDEYTFERWWKMYNHMVGRERCEVKWHNVLTASERKAATEHTPMYVASTPDKKFRKNPYTYLTQKCWNDAITGGVPAKLVEADAEKFMAYFNDKFKYTDIPKLTEMTDSRKKLLNVVYTLYRNDILDVFDKVLDSSYLNGESGKRRPITFEEIFNVDTFLKIKEGYYDK